MFGQACAAPNASRALVDILRAIVTRDPAKIEQLSDAVRGPKCNHIARSAQATRPLRPDQARAEEIYPGWFVGVNIANRDKAMILRAACDVYGLSMPNDVSVKLPNS